MRLFAALLCLCSLSAFAQDNFLKDYAPVAPTAASLGKYGEIPVGYHTGTPDISIPIHTLIEGAVSTSVSLSYHASGIRVQEAASWVGLGWALNAGGVITRTVQGAPDDGGNHNQEWAWYKNKGNPNSSTTCPATLINIARGYYDTEPDMFSFNVGGYTGKFFYNQDTVIQIVPRQDITIQTINMGGQTFSGWVLTDPQGTRYHFGATGAGMTMTDYVEKSAYTDDPFTATRNSSWYLSKIESADRKDVIQFSYVEEKYSFWEVSTSPTDGGIICTSNPGYCTGGSVRPPIRARIVGKRLSAITGTNGSIVFTGDAAVRTDLSNYAYCISAGCTVNTEAKALKTIEVRDKTNACLRKFDFGTTTITTTNPGNPPSTYLPSNGDETDKKRLILLSLSEQECGSTANAKTHNFEYFDQTLLPRRLSFAQDHWGYFNGKTTNTTLSPGEMNMKTLCNNCQGNYAHLCTAPPTNREPTFPSMRNGTLKKITFPTGGFSSFDYEAHTRWGTDTTCTEANIDTWNASTGSCNNGTFNTRTYTFNATQMATGHIELKWSNPFYIPGSCSASGSATLEVYVGPSATGLPIASINIGGSGSGPSIKYSFLSNVGGVALSAGTQYTFKLINSNGVGDVRFYTLTRVGFGTNKMVGGLRIKTITTDDGDATTSNNIVKNFEYTDPQFPTQSSGKVVHQPLYVGLYLVPCAVVDTATGCTGGNCNYTPTNANTYTACPTNCGSLPRLNAVYSYSALQPMQTTLGSHIGYTAVQVKETSLGKSQYIYNMGQYASGPWVPTGYPFPPPPYEPLLGTLAFEEHYEQNGTLLRSTQYNYQAYSVDVLTITGRHANKVHAASTGPITSQFYNMNTGYALLNWTQELQYNITGGTYVQKTTSIGYTTTNGHYQKTTEDVTDSDGTVYRTKYKYARDYPCPSSGACDETSATANAEGKVIYAMRKRNMIALPIEQTTWLSRPSWGGSFRLSGATCFQFDKVNTDYNNIKIKYVHQVRPAAPMTTFVESATSTSGVFTKDANYTQEYNFNFSDTHGKLLSQWKQNDPAKQQYLWGHNQKLPTAKIINAEASEVAYTGFEEPLATAAANGNWAITGSSAGNWVTTTGYFHTGRTGFNVGTARTLTASSLPAGTYVVSGWHRDGQIKVNGTNIGTAAGATWTYAETTLTLGANSSVTVTGTATNTYIDELRLCPSDALIRTFSFDDRSQLLLSVADENSVPSHYDYDTWQRLQAVRDQDRNILQTYEYNYRPGGGVLNDVKARTVLLAGQTTVSMVNALTGADVRRVFQYMDGLGRPVQTNEVAQSPTSLDIIGYNVYDQYGREPKKHIPYTITSNGGSYRTSAATEQSAFANTWGAGNYGYAETRFEPSPLHRPVEQAAPGATWRIGLNHTMGYAYRGNTASGDAVRNFTGAATFADNTLYTVEETDENGKKRVTFSDKLGRTVLVKQQIPATLTGVHDNDWACTYTAYDDFGRVAAVMPPETAKKMKTSGNWDYTAATYANMVFKYTYDSRGRMISKTVPSGGSTAIAYDRLDRPVLSTDPAGFKTFTRYDILSRPVVTGKYKGAASPGGSDPLYETPNTTTPHYYSSTAFPTDNNLDVYKVLYYDDYDLDNNGSLGTNETYTDPAESGYDAAAFLRLRGKPTAGKTGILKNDGTAPTVFLTTRTYYDKEYSVIQVNKQNHLSGADITSSAYDFANRITKTRRDHTATPPGGTLKTYTIREEYSYDHASRLRYARHHVGATTTVPTGNWVITSAPVYDELGRMADKRLHASNYDGISSISLTNITYLQNLGYLQSLDYTYNIRGWLTGINDVANCTTQSGDQLADLFKMQLSYNSPVGGGTAQYNGNISTMQWRTYIGTTCLAQQQYRFTYDGANRLKTADHYFWDGSVWDYANNYSESGINYDLNGNLSSYTRRGLVSGTATFGVIDQLTYTYGDATRPDRLTQVADAGNITKGFRYNSAAAAYQYDANGNMTQDNHKSLTIGYNFLNLPQSFTVTGANAGNFSIVYTADGEKLTKQMESSAATKQYVGGIEYTGTNLEAIYTSEGRCTPNGATAFFYEYTLKDHLGNARVNFRANGTAVTNLEDFHYYPFGMQMEGIGTTAASGSNKYRYNGKEMNDDFGVNLSDYGARWYDGALGRWWSVDPMGGKTVNHSTYHYALSNPLRFIDPNGMESEAYGRGLTGLAAEVREQSRKEQEEDRKEKEQKENDDKSGITLTVTDEIVGTGYVYADDQQGTDQYFEVNIYKMTATYIGKDGTTVSQDFEVLKYGVKYNKNKKSYYYQGFGNFNNLNEYLKITNPTYDSKYTFGGFNLYRGGLYDLHPQHTAIRDIPDAIGGRVNKGCIGVCGSGVDGWGGLTDILFTAAGMTNQVGEKQRRKKPYLAKMLAKINLTVVIQPFSIPNGVPTPIKK